MNLFIQVHNVAENYVNLLSGTFLVISLLMLLPLVLESSHTFHFIDDTQWRHMYNMSAARLF